MSREKGQAWALGYAVHQGPPTTAGGAVFLTARPEPRVPLSGQEEACSAAN